ncbi:hypothetical protein ACH489_08680 [Streptomyces rubiginosohelvolus]
MTPPSYEGERTARPEGHANRLADELLAQGSLDWLHTARGEGKA